MKLAAADHGRRQQHVGQAELARLQERDDGELAAVELVLAHHRLEAAVRHREIREIELDQVGLHPPVLHRASRWDSCRAACGASSCRVGSARHFSLTSSPAPDRAPARSCRRFDLDPAAAGNESALRAIAISSGSGGLAAGKFEPQQTRLAPNSSTALPRNASRRGLALHRLLDRPVGELEIDVRIFRQRPQRRGGGKRRAVGGLGAGEMVEQDAHLRESA